MINLRLNYAHPWLLLLLIPVAILTLVPHFRVAKKYRRTRNRIISLVLHALAMVLAVNLFAGLTIEYEIPNLNNEVILLVDISASNRDERVAKDDFVERVVNIADKEYKVGIVKFGYDQKYVAELSDNTGDVYLKYINSEDPDATSTNLAAALEYAKGLFTNPKNAKIVIISDGIETDGAATSVIKGIAAEGIKVDAICFPGEERDELQIMSVKIPEHHLMPGEEFTVDMVLRGNLNNVARSLIMKVYDNGKEIKNEQISVSNNEAVVSVDLTLEEGGIHELRFEIECEDDTVAENNVYHTYVNLEAFDNILLIERYENESATLQELLRADYNLTAMSIENDLANVPRDIHTLAKYEQVILVNVAYSDMPAGFEELLNQYVYDLGGGLFTLGGRNDIVDGETVAHAYNRQDMESSTYYKQMLPVNAVNYTPPIAVMVLIDCSESMIRNNKLQPAIDGAVSCLDALSDRDFCGVMSFQVSATEQQQVLPVTRKAEIIEAIRKLEGGFEGGPYGTVFESAIRMAGNALSVIDKVEKKHIIIVTDGEPSDTLDEYAECIRENREKGITMSVVTIDVTPLYKDMMADTAEEGGGTFYNVTTNEIHTLPNVMRQDIAMETIAEIQIGEFIPSIGDTSSILAGIAQDTIPKLYGYYGTVVKEGATVPLKCPFVPIYAHWKYGNGNVGSFMSSLDGEGGAAFINDSVGKTILTNIVNSLFPLEDVRADKIQYVMKTDNYSTQMNIYGAGKEHTVELTVAPVFEALRTVVGDTVAVKIAESNRRFTFEIRDAGLYEIRIKELDEMSATVSEVVIYKTFSYSEEYNEFTEKEPIGASLLELLVNNGGGASVTDPVEVFMNFSKTLKREYDPRILFLILIIIFVLFDIAVRKFKFKWPHELVREYKQRKADNAEKKGEPRETR